MNRPDDIPETRHIGGDRLDHDWTPTSSETVHDNKVFRLRRDMIERPRRGGPSDFYVLESREWVNIVALTPEREIILVRQFRVARRRESLEIPGGVVDRGEDPADAAVRELEEETGFTGDPPIFLGAMEPNPAILDNLTHTYLIENCAPNGRQNLDAGEQVRVEAFPVDRVDELIASGQITHALVITGLSFYRCYKRTRDAKT